MTAWGSPPFQGLQVVAKDLIVEQEKKTKKEQQFPSENIKV